MKSSIEAALTVFDALDNFPLSATPFILVPVGLLMIVTKVPCVPPGLGARVLRQTLRHGALSSNVPRPNSWIGPGRH